VALAWASVLSLEEAVGDKDNSVVTGSSLSGRASRRRTLVSVEAEDVQVRGVVASSVLALDDDVDAWPRNRSFPA
jgi:hypothetical protein